MVYGMFFGIIETHLWPWRVSFVVSIRQSINPLELLPCESNGCGIATGLLFWVGVDEVMFEMRITRGGDAF